MTQIQVHLADLPGGAGRRDMRVGTIYANTRRGRLTSVFSYDPAYVVESGAYAIDPAIPLGAGSWPSRGSLPQAVLDAAPDRWGRMLVAKREAALARESGRAPRSLNDADFLLGVADLTRQGALRFALTPGGEFHHPVPEVPKLVELPALLQAADEAARDGDETGEAVRTLLDAGSASLGGARPKAAVRDGERLTIAKFPHAGDRWDVMAWEAVALGLARAAGIAVAATRLVQVAGRAVLLSERFDRRGASRVGYISALTATGLNGAAQADYLDVVNALAQVSADPSRDLADLWRRIALSVAIHNTDDHLRNLGLLRVRGGWRLSPAFDLNPNPVGATARVTPLGGATGADDTAATLLAYAEAFGLTAGQARQEAARVACAVSRWSSLAEGAGVSKPEQERFRGVFESGTAALASL
ncbi:MAG: type II toxin-antitoxin system HipA family toxin [Bifidobacteriaceae bacterium]|jgi:serine/threonine-protein kinase HipA|nr:type II toxin-antitoxin system HipA family toxin [Bifidobacteriaceae bacterium]